MRSTVIFLLMAATGSAAAAETVQPSDFYLVEEVALYATDSAVRSRQADAVEMALVSGATRPAAEPDTVLMAGDGGWIEHESLEEGYALATVTMPADTTLILEAMGYLGCYVNGEMRQGNVYGYTDQWESWQPHFDFSLLPVRLHAGENHLLFFGNRYGLLRARLWPARAPLLLNPRDATLPDLVSGEPVATFGAVVVMNATGEVVADASLAVTVEGGSPTQVAVPVLPPFGVRKVPFPLSAPAPREDAGEVALEVAVSRGGGQTLDSADLALAVRRPDENRRVTFVSRLDGSVQYYGLRPASGPEASALILSLHGASVEAINQSGSYAAIPWAHVVAPTNRRPFGFNWEDWGRLDALEVLDLATASLDVAEDRIYLTGHSMGGHGSWHLSTLYPDRFAAVGPSAGWISFWSYRPDRGAGQATPLDTMLDRATLPSRTMEFARNLQAMGVYILHGDADAVVEVTEARTMYAHLDTMHRDLDLHEEPGAGHWWDHQETAGADCVHWPPLLDFFARHRRPATGDVRSFSFATPSPGVNDTYRWVRVQAQQKPFMQSVVDAEVDPAGGWASVNTRNVAVLGLDLAWTGHAEMTAVLDGDTLAVTPQADTVAWFGRDGEAGPWRAMDTPDPARRGAHRQGGLREAFGNRVQLVYGTAGSAEETAWALARARYDAEDLWYRGNSSLDVLPDTLYDPTADPDRNVILYGNADTHRHWQTLWTGEDVVVRRGNLKVGGDAQAGEDLGIMAVRPRPGSGVASVGIVGGTGPAGMRLTDRRPYLAPSVAYPDLTVLRAGPEGVVQQAGFFGDDWTLEGGEIVKR
jgi:poly(3-hydroxybutyrate) depolymerase